MSAQYGDTRNGYAAMASAARTQGPNVRSRPSAGTGVPQRLGDGAGPEDEDGDEGEEPDAVGQAGDLVAEDPAPGQRLDDAEQGSTDEAQQEVLEAGEHADDERLDLQQE